MTDFTDESVKALLDGATPGRRVQFHGSYCPEAVGTPFSDWDTSHDVSVIRPDGSRYRLAHYKHASDAYLSQMAPDLACALLDARAELSATQTQVGDWIVRADEANVKVETLEAELARVKADAAAAQALVVEQCAKGADRRYAAGDMGNPGHHIRALAPADGLAMVQELRAEIASLAYSMGRAASERDLLAAENASLKAREKVDANLLLAAYKGLLVLHRMLSKSGLSVGAETATYITDQIAAAHPEMPGLASLRAALAQTPTEPGDTGDTATDAGAPK